MIVRWLLLCTNKRIFASMSIAMINLQRQQPPLQTNLFSNLWGKRVHTLSRSISHFFFFFFLNTSPQVDFKKRYTCVVHVCCTIIKSFRWIKLTLLPILRIPFFFFLFTLLINFTENYSDLKCSFCLLLAQGLILKM